MINIVEHARDVAQSFAGTEGFERFRHACLAKVVMRSEADTVSDRPERPVRVCKGQRRPPGWTAYVVGLAVFRGRRVAPTARGWGCSSRSGGLVSHATFRVFLREKTHLKPRSRIRD
jgi:hypothetical protein